MSRSRGRARRRSATPAPDRRPAPAARSRQRRPSAVHSVAPPAVALVISSPAIVAGLTGTTEPLNAFAIVVVALTASWVLSAVGVKVADTVPARIGAPPARSLDTGSTTGDHRVTGPGETRAQLLGQPALGTVGFTTGRAEDTHRGWQIG